MCWDPKRLSATRRSCWGCRSAVSAPPAALRGGGSGLFDRRLGKSPWIFEWVLELPELPCKASTVKHFHVRAHHGFPLIQLDQDGVAAGGLVSRAPRRGAARRPRSRAAAWLRTAHSQPDTLDEPVTRPSWCTVLDLPGAEGDVRRARSIPTAADFHTPEAGGSARSGAPCTSSRLLTGGPRPLGARLRHPAGPAGQGAGAGRHRHRRGRQPLHRRALPARPQPPLRDPARAQVQQPLMSLGDRLHERPPLASSSRRTAAPGRNPNPRVTRIGTRYLPRRCGRSHSAPDHFPTGPTTTTERSIHVLAKPDKSTC